MTRGGGSVEPGYVYHLISRFVAKEWFVDSARERDVYLALLGAAIPSTDWRCFCYAVMSSHIHLGLVAGTEPLAEWLRPLHTTFAQWLNESRDRIGAVFVKGPNLVPTWPQATSRLIQYIHCNPVRAGVVAHPSSSCWTSHQAYVGFTQPPSWLEVGLGLELGGFASAADFQVWSDLTRVDRDELERTRIVPRKRRRTRDGYESVGRDR